MGKFFKYTAIFFAIIVIILLAAPPFISLDSYKELAISKVREITGRDLKINGALSLSVLPNIAVKVKDIELSSVAGAKYNSLLKAGEVVTAVSILSLLKGNIEIAAIIIDPVVNLEHLSNGSTSWQFTQDKTQASTDNATVESNSDNTPLELSIDLIKIINGQINYLDSSSKNNKPLTVNIENLEIKDLHGPNNLSGKIYSSGKNYGIDGNIQEKQGVITSNLNLELFKEKITISGDLSRDNMTFIGKMNLQGNSKNLEDIFPNIKILNHANHTVNCNINGGKKLLVISDINLTSGKIVGIGNANLSPEDGKIDAEIKLNPGNINLTISLIGNSNNKISITTTAIKPLLDELAINLKDVPSKVLNQAFAISTSISYSDQNLSLNNIDLKIDKASLKGDLGLKDWDKSILANYNLQIDDPQTLASLFAINLPVNLNNISIKGQATKEQEVIKTTSSVMLANTTSNIQGSVALGKFVKPNLTIESTGSNLGGVIGQLTKSPVNNAVGSYSLLTKVEGDSAGDIKININKFDLVLGKSPMNLTGIVNVNFAATKAKISSDLKITSINLNNISSSPSSNSPPSHGQTAVSSTNSSPWSQNKIDLSCLKKFDGNLNLSIGQIIQGGIVLDTVHSNISLINGILDIKSFNGKIYGGDLEAHGQISAEGSISLKTNLHGASLKNMLKQTGKINIVNGIVNFIADIKTNGQSQMQYISNLSGNTNLTASSGSISGFDLQKISALLKNIRNPAEIMQNFEEGFSGGETQFENLIISTEIKNGVASITRGKLDAGNVGVTASGTVNLPNYSSDVSTIVILDSNKSYPPFTVRFYGSLNNIQHKIELKDLQQYLINNVIGGLIQGGKPKDILNNIIKGNKNSESIEEDKSSNQINDLIGKELKGLLK
ncbi:MAG: AsmA family protein [Rickettsia endosymbiont of Bryobia graminum]|nr:AsmA family protein [Rickettsia endosymbiont of Bryobia graminum]